jgi:hypothetical protein
MADRSQDVSFARGRFRVCQGGIHLTKNDLCYDSSAIKPGAICVWANWARQPRPFCHIPGT